MMAATRQALDRECQAKAKTKVLAVTILTSSTEETLKGVGIDLPVPEMVVKLAKLAQSAGIDGVVASPLETSLIREACGKDFLIVTPGVRPSFAAVNDQKRIMTPVEAVQAGADFLVIGRPIAAASDPVAACDSIIDEICA
jgi:orotidine-5'-phosphate decarboxylase